MSLYDIGSMDNITSPFLVANDLMGGGMIGHLILLTVFTITTFGLLGAKEDMVSAIGFALLITFIVNILLLPLGITSVNTIIIILLGIIGTFFIGKKV